MNQTLTNSTISVQEELHRYRVLFVHHPAPMLIIDPQTTMILEANKSAIDFYGYSPQELAKMKITDINIQATVITLSNIQEAISGKHQSFRFKHRLANGSIRDVDVITGAIDYEGKTVLFSIINDVTDKIKKDSLLATLTTIIQTSEDIAFIKNVDFKIINANNSFLKAIGKSSLKEVYGHTIVELFGLDSQGEISKKLHNDDMDTLLLKQGDMIVRNEEFTLPNGYHRKFYSKKFPIYVDSNAVALAVVMTDKTEKYRNKFQKTEREARIHRQKSALVTLMQTNSAYKDNPEKNYSSIVSICARTLEVDLASIWFFNEDQTKLICVEKLAKQQRKDPTSTILDMTEFPIYKQSLSYALTFAIHDVYDDPRTVEFVEDYFKSNNIFSMMDAPIRVSGEIIGVICFEHTDCKRYWHDDEEMFATAVADYIAQISSLVKIKLLQNEIELLKMKN